MNPPQENKPAITPQQNEAAENVVRNWEDLPDVQVPDKRQELIAYIQQAINTATESLRRENEELKRMLFRSQEMHDEPSQRDELAIIKSFCEEVNRRAEGNMLKTGKLEGSHYAAMTQILKERQTLATKEKNES